MQPWSVMLMSVMRSRIRFIRPEAMRRNALSSRVRRYEPT